MAKDETSTLVIQFRLRPALYERLQRRAEMKGVSMADICRLALDDYLGEQKEAA